MATTSLWHIEGRLKDLIAYVENPEKTRADTPNLQPLWDIFSYVSRPEATEQGEYVSAVNCLKEIALQQMILTKKQYGKENGYIAWHGYQSFKPNEVSPEQAHQIGLQTAKEMWGDKYQIIVTTHLDKDHLHNHFCFNSVSFLDGKKYNYSKAEQRKLRNVSDRICMEHGLSVIENPHKSPSRQVWLDEKSGKPTRYNVYREDVKEAINFSRRPYYMEEYLRRKGYITDFTGKHWKIRLPQYEHFTRLDTLDKRWTPENIERTMGVYASFGNRRATINYPPQMPQDLRNWFQPFHKTSHIYKLYLHLEDALESFKDEKACESLIGIYGSKEKAVEASLKATGDKGEFIKNKDAIDKTYKKFAYAMKNTDDIMAMEAVKELGENYKNFFKMDNAKALLLKVAKDYLNHSRLEKGTDRQYGKGITKYIGEAISKYYGEWEA